ncbi:MAG: choice-of-anchor J domain-containing protein [Planctomycetota bacterium]
MKRTLFCFVCAALVALQSPARADLFEGFDSLTGLDSGTSATQITASGFYGVLRSDPAGLTGIFQGNSSVFPAQAGAANSYAGMNYDNTGDNGTISTWLLSPVFNLSNGDKMSFWTRTIANSSFPDRLEVRLSTSGASTDVGTSATSVGTFATVLTTINPGLNDTDYPEAWTQYQFTLSGLSGPTSGRFDFRYFVTDAGYFGNNSNYIGIDSFQYTAVPEPSAISLLVVGLVAAMPKWRRRSEA